MAGHGAQDRLTTGVHWLCGSVTSDKRDADD